MQVCSFILSVLPFGFYECVKCIGGGYTNNTKNLIYVMSVLLGRTVWLKCGKMTQVEPKVMPK